MNAVSQTVGVIRTAAIQMEASSAIVALALCSSMKLCVLVSKVEVMKRTFVIS